MDSASSPSILGSPAFRNREQQVIGNRVDQVVDVEANIREYLRHVRPLERYASFDYCFNYFQSFREQQTIAQVASPAHLQESCFQLGFYLASWGMLRGSSFLLNKSGKIYVPVIKAIARVDPRIWDIDVHCYTASNVDAILEFKETLTQVFGNINSPSDILVTKIMLGVFGNVPAFDTYFKKGFSISSFGRRALEKVARFYEAHKIIVEQYRIPTLDFETGEPTQRRYSRAKVIDMIFFIAGGRPLTKPGGKPAHRPGP